MLSTIHAPRLGVARQLTMGMGWPRRLLSSSRVSSRSTSLTANSQVPATQHDILQRQWHLHLSEGIADVTTSLQLPASSTSSAPSIIHIMQAVSHYQHSCLLQLQPICMQTGHK